MTTLLVIDHQVQNNKMAPILSPSSSSSSIVMGGGPSRTASTSSIQSVASLLVSTVVKNEVEVVREEGLRHAKVRLEAR